MITISHRLIASFFTVLMFFITSLYSAVVSAHSDGTSILQTVLGENLSHWLISHQGLIIVVVVSMVTFFSYYYVAIKSKKSQ